MRRIDVIGIGIGVFIAGGLIYLVLKNSGLDGISAGIWSQAILVGGLVGWVLSYLVRVLNHKMTYNQQLEDYKTAVLEKRLEQMTPEELEKLQAEIDNEPKRQYNLPNCTLVVEGLSDGITNNTSDGQSTLSIVTNAECHLIGTNKVLQGGRTFLENLAKAVSSYAQECLSGVRRPHEETPTDDRIYIEKVSDSHHRLVWYPPSDIDTSERPVTVDLSTVQLFDLVEAVDQFYTDQRTLPDVNLKLEPLPRRYRQGDEPIVKKAVPMAVGLSSLAIVAAVSYLLPVPEIRKPDPNPPLTPSQTLPQTPQPGASPIPRIP